MNNCPCPTDTVPAQLCCPNTTELGSSIVVKDKDCNDRRIIVNGAGVLAAKNNKAGMMDGSAEKPLTMDFETFFAANGYILLQDPGGRVIAVKPNEDLYATDAVLQLVFQDGAVKFVPVSYSALFADADTPSTTRGIMAMLSCGGSQGLLKLGKFTPFAQTQSGGPWSVVVDTDNNVYASDVAIDECPATDSVDQLNALIGCVDGKWKTILPVKDKTLVGVEVGGTVKWALKDGTGSLVDVPRTNIYSKHSEDVNFPITSSDNGTINISSLAGYLAEYRYAMLHFKYFGFTQNWALVNNVSIEGRNYIGIHTPNVDNFTHFNSQNSSLVAIPTSKVWNVSILKEAEASGSIPHGGKHYVDIFIDGWMK